MLVAITGGTGFIGRELVLRHVAAGDEVRILTRCATKCASGSIAAKWFEGDLTMPSCEIERFVDGVDVLYHCAAEIRDEQKMRSVHVDGTRNLCKAALGRVGHWVQLSSVGVYGPQRSGVISEASTLQPVGIYEQTKAESDWLVINEADKNAFTYSIVRPSNVFGPRMSNQSLHQLISMIRRKLFFYIGKPGAMANYIFVDNVVDALMRCGRMEGAINRIFNLSDHSTVEYFVATLADALGVANPRIRVPEWAARFLARYCGRFLHLPLTVSRIDALTSRAIYSNKMIENELAYTHSVSMKDGLRLLVGAFEKA